MEKRVKMLEDTIIKYDIDDNDEIRYEKVYQSDKLYIYKATYQIRGGCPFHNYLAFPRKIEPIFKRWGCPEGLEDYDYQEHFPNQEDLVECRAICRPRLKYDGKEYK